LTITGRRVTGSVAIAAAGGTRPSAELSNLFIADRFPASEPDVAADERPRVQESDPSLSPVGIVVADEISAVA
jgi:hypothetical protein